MNGELESQHRARRRHPREKLSSFLCQEMLYQYVSKTLDSASKEAVEKRLQQDPSSQEALQALQQSLGFCARMKTLEADHDMIKRLQAHEGVTSIAARSLDWSEWPKSVWASIILIASLSASLVVISFTPWQNLSIFKPKPTTQTVVLAEVPVADGTSSELDPNDVKADAEGNLADSETETSGDEHLTGEEAEATPPPPTPTPAVIAATSPRPSPTPLPAPSPAIQPPAPIGVGASASGVAAATPEPVATPSRDAKPRGFVYRAFLNTDAVEQITPELVQKLVEFGGVKAGEVPLGWRRGAGSYFHFTVPAENESKVKELFRVYGPVRISKDPHPRVMPEGQVRFILWVEPQSPSSN